MKKNLWLTVVVSAVIIIGVGFFAYHRFIRPAYLNSTQELTVSVGGLDRIALSKNDDQSKIYGIEIEFLGEVDGIMDIEVAQGASQTPIHYVSVKGPEIDYIYKADWYSDSCFLQLESRENATGEIQINYRFLGLN